MPSPVISNQGIKLYLTLEQVEDSHYILQNYNLELDYLEWLDIQRKIKSQDQIAPAAECG